MIDKIAALVLLVIVFGFASLIAYRVKQEDLKEVFLSTGVVVVAGSLFCVLLVVQLLQPQTWMADVLKVVAGVVAGAVAAKKVDAKEKQAAAAQQVAIGEQIQQAARDINNVKSELSKIENSVVNQFARTSERLAETIVAYRDTDRFDISYRDDVDVQAAYDRLRQDFPNGIQYKPILGPEVRRWYNRQVDFFSEIPGATSTLAERVAVIRDSGWEVIEVRFDFSSVNVVVLLETQRRLTLNDVALHASA
jgi:hypothetical protein